MGGQHRKGRQQGAGVQQPQLGMCCNPAWALRRHMSFGELLAPLFLSVCAKVVDGTVHPLTAATLSFLRRLFTYPNVGAVSAMVGDGWLGGGEQEA